MNDDGRIHLPTDLKPMEEVELSLIVNTPRKPGDYVLELDLVQEAVAWFKDKGSEATRVRVQVEGTFVSAILRTCRRLVKHTWARIISRRFNPLARPAAMACRATARFAGNQ